MIYRKNANFPYPVLTDESKGYEENYLELEIEISETADCYRFDFEYTIDSKFIKELLQEGKAQPILIIQSKDNKFFKLEPRQSKVKIPKSRISINSRTSVQLHIQALENISFNNNVDLNAFYEQFKAELTVPQYSLLGYSNVVVFDGNMKKPFDLFERKLNENLRSDIKIELGLETIIIHYKSRDHQLHGLPNALHNAYIYAGLTKALQKFVLDNGQDGDVDLLDIPEPENLLDLKLYNLMRSKNVEEVHTENIDEVIAIISDRIIDRFSMAVRRLEASGS